MTGLAEPGMRVLLSRSASPTRKLPLSWELVEADGGLSRHQHGAPQPARSRRDRCRHHCRARRLRRIRREVNYGRNSRIDLLLSAQRSAGAYVEVKNVHLSRGRRLSPSFRIGDRPRHQASGRAGRHGRRRPSRGDALPRPAHRLRRLPARGRHRPHLCGGLCQRRAPPASRRSPMAAGSTSTRSQSAGRLPILA